MGDPLSLTLACTSLISTIAKTLSFITSFVKRCRAARHDRDNISREITSLKNALGLLRHDIDTTNDQAIPKNLRKEITTSITNCDEVLRELDELLQRHNGGVDQTVCWATTGTHDAAKLRLSLDGYRGALNLDLDLLTQHRVGEIRNDTTAIKQDISLLLAIIGRLNGPFLAGESWTQSSEDRNNSDSENDRRISKSSISSYNSNSPSLSQEPVQDIPSPFPPDIQKGERGNSRTGKMRSFFFVNRRSSSYSISLKGHHSWVLAVAFSPDGKLVASASLDGTVRLWDSATGKDSMTFKGHSDCVRAVAFSPPDGKLIASASLDNTFMLWDVATGQSCREFKGHKDSVQAVAFSPNGKLVASSSDDCTVKLWDPDTGQVRRTFEGHTGSIWAVAFSPDGKLVASASLDGTVRLWDPATGKGRMTFKGHSDCVRAVAFSPPDGKLVASASHDCTVRLWDPATGRVCRTFNGHEGDVHAIAFSPDGKLVASASLDNTVRLWDVATGQKRGMLLGHKNSVQAVAFSPDGKIVASSSNDRTIRLWDPARAEK